VTGETVFVVDENETERAMLREILVSAGHNVVEFSSALEFLMHDQTKGSCVLTETRMAGIDGVDLMLARRGSALPVIIVTGDDNVQFAVRAMKAGATDFILKPYDKAVLLSSVADAVEIAKQARLLEEEAAQTAQLIAQLTTRELEVLKHLAQGCSNKLVAATLGISPRTVEVHRGHLRRKLKARGLPDLVRAANALAKASQRCRIDCPLVQCGDGPGQPTMEPQQQGMPGRAAVRSRTAA